jgi:Flp pilus assembly CpaE family ATPase
VTATLPVRLALGLDNPRLLAAVLGWIEETDDEHAPPFRVLGRPCTVVRLCGSERELRAALAGDTVDALVVSSVLHAVPLDELRALAEAARGRLVVLAPDCAAPHWDAFPAPVLEAEPSAAALAQALAQGMVGTASSSPSRRTDRRSVKDVAASELADPPSVDRATLIHMTGAAAPDGASTVAAALAFAVGTVAPTVLLDASWQRGGTQEFHFGVDPHLNVCMLAHREPKSPADWAAGLRAELQNAGPPSTTEILCGVPRPALRSSITPKFVEGLLGELRRHYRFVFTDGSGLGWATDDPPLDRQVLNAADHVLLVVRADEQGIARATRAVHDWPHRERLRIVLNMAGLPGSEQPRAVAEALGAPVVAVVPADARGVAAARARYRPVVCQPGCRASRPLLELAGQLVGGRPLSVPVDTLPRARNGWRRVAAPLLGLFD